MPDKGRVILLSSSAIPGCASYKDIVCLIGLLASSQLFILVDFVLGEHRVYLYYGMFGEIFIIIIDYSIIMIIEICTDIKLV